MQNVKADLKNGVIEIEGIKYIREDLLPKEESEEITIRSIRPIYWESSAYLSVYFDKMPKTKLRPGWKIKFSVTEKS